MISKYRDKPILMEKMEALLSRLPAHHPAVHHIENELQKVRAGFHGEKEVDYHLRELDRPGIFILHDLRLKTNTGTFFQIDTLILTESAAILLEIKNYAGPLTYDSKARQLIRPPKVMPNPFLQVRRQQNHFQNVLLGEQLSQLPTKAFVVFTNPQTRLLIEPLDEKISNMLLYPSEISSKIQSSSKRISRTELSHLASQLKKLNRPLSVNILSRFTIDPSAIIKGIRCPHCGKWGIIRGNGGWDCTFCWEKSRTAHYQALYDYCLLFGAQLTLNQSMIFLQMSSRHAVRRLLLPLSTRTKRLYSLNVSLLRLKK